MRRSDNRQDGGAVGLRPALRERQPLGRLGMLAGDRPLTGDDAWALLAVAYAGGDGRGAEARTIGDLSRVIRRGPRVDESAVRASLGRLRGAGLVVEAEGVHHPAEPVVAFFRSRTHRRSVWHDYRDLVRHLGLDRHPGR